MHGPGYGVSLLGGFRYLELIEGLDLTLSEISAVPPPFLGNPSVASAQSFHTRNYFYGGQAGADVTWCHGCFLVNATGKVALGDVYELAGINGSTTTRAFTGATSTIHSALFAQPSNIGRHSRDNFAVVPEINLTLGYAITHNVQASLGYSFLYLSNAMRPGDAIDRSINTSQIPTPVGPSPLIGAARPTFLGKDSDFWAQGIRFGLQIRF
jgi:hypothetical protein